MYDFLSIGDGWLKHVLLFDCFLIGCTQLHSHYHGTFFR